MISLVCRYFRKKSYPRGVQLITALMIVFVIGVFGVATAQYITNEFHLASYKIDRDTAMEIAESGAEYYRWHLAHVQDDFKDGTGVTGPYVHDYYNAQGVRIGQFSLTITPPPTGSTVVTIASTGYLIKSPDLKRTVTIQMGIPSFSQYAVVANDVMRFGTGTEVFGPIHSNFGIRFDGLAHNLVTSYVAQYQDPDHVGGPEFGVHTHISPVDPYPPAAAPNRPDVFAAGRSFPASYVNFTGITVDLGRMQTDATASGIALPLSGVNGYHVKINPNDTVDITMVSTLATCQYRTGGRWYSVADINSIGSETSFTYKGRSSLGIPFPANGIIFLSDDAWVDGNMNGGHLTIVAAKDPLASGTANIFINNNLTYTNYDGSDTLGLIAQQNIGVGYYSADILRIDAAVIAQKGWVRRYYYPPRTASTWNPANCNQYVYRNTITTFGSIATNQRYGFAYTDGTGYQIRNLTFDEKLRFAPPPSFPTTGKYSIISWQEK